MDLQDNAGNWVDSAQDRDYWIALVNAALSLRVPQAMELVKINSLAVKTCIYNSMYYMKSSSEYLNQ